MSSNLQAESTRLRPRMYQGTFFLGEGGGGLGNFGIFFPQKVLALLCVLIKKTPDPEDFDFYCAGQSKQHSASL